MFYLTFKKYDVFFSFIIVLIIILFYLNFFSWFENYSKMDFAKSGFVAKETVALPAGPLLDFSFSMEPQLRTLGLPTQLEKGVIVLREEYVVCRAGTHLSPEQAQILVS